MAKTEKQRLILSFHQKPRIDKRLRVTETINFPLTKEQLESINKTLVSIFQKEYNKRKVISITKLPCKDIILEIEKTRLYINDSGVITELKNFKIEKP